MRRRNSRVLHVDDTSSYKVLHVVNTSKTTSCLDVVNPSLSLLVKIFVILGLDGEQNQHGQENRS